MNQKTQTFIMKATRVHGDRYDYSLTEYNHSKEKVIIVCKIHGEFEQSPNSHLRGKGCAKCANELNGKAKRLSVSDFIRRATEIHSGRYNYDEISEIVSVHKVVTIVCKEHGKFAQTPASHLSGKGCATCAGGERYTREMFIRRAREVHGDYYDYSKCGEISSKMDKVTIICSKHGEFVQRAEHHLRGSGCTVCARYRTSGVSKIGTQWLNSLRIDTLIHEYSLPENRKQQVDAYDPVTNTVYQFHGDYWHGNLSRYDADKINLRNKRTFGELYESTIQSDSKIREWGYNLVTMWESDFKQNDAESRTK